MKSRLVSMRYRLIDLVAMVACALVVWPSGPAAGETVVVAGYGPERGVIERLARTFERQHLGSVVSIRWNRNLKAIDLVKAGEADFAVTGAEAAGLAATRIAWDGIAVIVNFANTVHELTKAQVAALFMKQVRRWTELGGADTPVQVIGRPADRNLTGGFREGLGLDGPLPAAPTVVRSDQKALSTVGGRLAAVSYISLFQALQAVTFGMPIRVLLIDGIEAGEPTVRSGRYPLRRPVLLLSRPQRTPSAEAFIEFVRSPEARRILDEIFVLD